MYRRIQETINRSDTFYKGTLPQTPLTALERLIKSTPALHRRHSSLSTYNSQVFSEDDEAEKERKLQEAIAKEEIRLSLTAHTMVDTVDSLQACVDEIVSIAKPYKPGECPDLMLDAEGGNGHGRHNNLNFIQVMSVSADKTWIIDTRVLGQKVMDTPSSTTGRTFGQILEDKSIAKVLWDTRQDSDAIYAHFGIHMRGIHDLQVMEAAVRPGSRAKALGLADAIEQLPKEYLSPLTIQVWKEIKEDGRLFCKANGGYRAFDIRPAAPVLEDYAANDCSVLPILYRCYMNSGCKDKKLRDEPELMDLVLRASARRVDASLDPDYRGNSESSYLGPPEMRALWTEYDWEGKVNNWMGWYNDDGTPKYTASEL